MTPAVSVQVEVQLLFIRDSMKQIFDLYRYSNVSSASWDPVKTQNFLESINRQIQELNRCVSSRQHSGPNPQQPAASVMREGSRWKRAW